MTDGQLLERFLAGRNEGGELAFEALVMRHGPMVMRVCRNLVGDPNDVHDAFQAVFLVLARRASAIRDRESVGSWLYGVAARVAARARASAIAVTFGSGERNRRRSRSLQSFRIEMKHRRPSGPKPPSSSTTN
jgi:RNA polymerase sigma-70 factor (ECF subfamily)